jgi:hypothetical protein
MFCSGILNPSQEGKGKQCLFLQISQKNGVDFERGTGAIKFASAGQQFIYTLQLLFSNTQIDLYVGSVKGGLYIMCLPAVQSL